MKVLAHISVFLNLFIVLPAMANSDKPLPVIAAAMIFVLIISYATAKKSGMFN